MNSREQTLAIILIGAIVATVAGAGGYFFVLSPLNKQRNAEAALRSEIAELEGQVEAQEKAAKRLAVARVRSLPADESLARREYTVALERMAEAAGVPKGYTITPKSADNSARSVPEVTKGKPVYTRLAYDITFKKVDMAAVKNFLERYHRLGLLHQITSLNIKKDDDPSAKSKSSRADLTVILTTEAIIVDGAENRKTLLPVPTAFAAIGGAALYRGMAASPEYARGVAPQALVPVLAANPRDYNLIVQKDPFHGPLPPEKEPEPFKLLSLKDVKVKPEKTPDPVKVYLTGEGAVGAKVTAIAAGSLFAEGALKVESKPDSKTHTIELPSTSASEGTATISVIATSADGSKIEKASFKVSLEEVVEVKREPGEDISASIILTGAAPRSDGTAWARIFDNANRLRYTIEATPKGVTVLKEYKRAATLPWRKDVDHDHPAGVLVISDEETRTHRTFRVVAVDIEGLIVADLKPEGAAEKPKAPPGKGVWPPRDKPKPAPANPLAAIGGNMSVAVQPPKFYRWPVGQSLKSLKALSDEDARKIQKAVGASGPVFDVSSVVSH